MDWIHNSYSEFFNKLGTTFGIISKFSDRNEEKINKVNNSKGEISKKSKRNVKETENSNEKSMKNENSQASKKVKSCPVCLPIVICGPSGVGKGTLIDLLQKEFPNSFKPSISTTTRSPRGKEKDGVEYFFTSNDKFETLVEKGEFLEHAYVHGKYYGTNINTIDNIRKERKLPVLDIDVQGAEQLRKKNLEAQYIFILPPSFEALEDRLRGRKTENEEKIKLRLNNSRTEINSAVYGNIFDVLVINDNLFKCFDSIKAIVRENREKCDDYNKFKDIGNVIKMSKE